MTYTQIVVQILEYKKEEILNYDMDEPWAEETLNAIAWAIEHIKSLKGI